MLFYKTYHRNFIIFWILKKTKKCLQKAVSCPAPHTAYRSVQKAYPHTARLNGIGKRKLLIIMRMDSHRLSRRVCRLHIFLRQFRNLLWIKRTKAVHQIYHIHRTFSQKLQRRVQIIAVHLRYRHNIYCHFISLFLKMLYHLHGSRNLMNIGSYPYKVDDTVFFGKNILLIIAAPYICHHRNF